MGDYIKKYALEMYKKYGHVLYDMMFGYLKKYQDYISIRYDDCSCCPA